MLCDAPLEVRGVEVWGDAVADSASGGVILDAVGAAADDGVVASTGVVFGSKRSDGLRWKLTSRLACWSVVWLRKLDDDQMPDC